MADPVPAHRNLVPIDQFITSSCPDGVVMTMDVYIDPSKLAAFVKIVTPAVHRIRKLPENLFCEVSVDPTDRGHIRVIHGWTTDSAWFRENLEAQPWFLDYVKALAGIRDPSRNRVVQHYDRIPIN